MALQPQVRPADAAARWRGGVGQGQRSWWGGQAENPNTPKNLCSCMLGFCSSSVRVRIFGSRRVSEWIFGGVRVKKNPNKNPNNPSEARYGTALRPAIESTRAGGWPFKRDGHTVSRQSLNRSDCRFANHCHHRSRLRPSSGDGEYITKSQ